MSDEFYYDDYNEPVENEVSTDKEIVDIFDRTPAFRLGFVGVGQCGNNLATAFHRIGYRRVLLINTATGDLNAIEDQIAKLPIDTQGAGKDPELGAKRTKDKLTEIRTQILRECSGFEKLVICMGLGGGTGSGGGPEIVKTAQQLVNDIGGDIHRDVIAIVTLPNPRVDGPRQCFNALQAYGQLCKLNIPLVTVDNTLVEKAVPTNYSDIWGPVNMWIARTFHAFNNFAGQESQQGVLDACDLNDIISRGNITFSACAIGDISDKHAISDKIINNLKRSLFAQTDLSTADAAGCIVLINENVKDKLAAADIAPAFETLNSLMRKNSTLHRGIYIRNLPSKTGTGPAMFWYVILSGIARPEETLTRIFDKAKNYSQEYGNLGAFFS
jgi:cell division protein FtsZ